MARRSFSMALLTGLLLLAFAGCASSHQHLQTDAGYATYGDTGGGWQTVQSFTAP
jgi:hypothetical protein